MKRLAHIRSTLLPALALGLLTGLAPAPGVAEEFVVGVELPLTGTLARVGGGMNEGIMVATDVFNRKNGKHRIKLITIDDESSPAKAIAAVEKLASQNVVAITGGYGSNNIGPASDAANLIEKCKIGCLPVLDEGKVVGIVTEADFVRFAKKYFERQDAA